MYREYYALDPIGDDYLEQHGILGQKWYQRNGPPYPLGSGSGSRRSASESRLNGAKRSASAIAKGSAKVINSFNRIKDKRQAEVDARNEYAKKAKDHRKQMSKGFHELSDEDLDKRIDRLTKEQRYKQLVDSVYPDQKKPGFGSRIIKGGSDALGKSLLNGVSKYLDKSIEDAIDKMIEGDSPKIKWWEDTEWMDLDKTKKEREWMVKQATDYQKSKQGVSMMKHYINRQLTLDDGGSDPGDWYDKKPTKSMVETWIKENNKEFETMVKGYLKDLGGRPIT